MRKITALKLGHPSIRDVMRKPCCSRKAAIQRQQPQAIKLESIQRNSPDLLIDFENCMRIKSQRLHAVKQCMHGAFDPELNVLELVKRDWLIRRIRRFCGHGRASLSWVDCWTRGGGSVPWEASPMELPPRKSYPRGSPTLFLESCS